MKYIVHFCFVFLFVHPFPTRAEDPLLAKQLREPPAEVILNSPVVQIPMLGTPSVPLVRLFINNQGPFVFQLNTGNDFMLVRKELAEKLGLPVIGSPGSGSICTIDEVRIEQAVFRNLKAGIQEWPEGVDGIAGYNLFMNCVLAIDFPSKRYSISMKELEKPDGMEILKYKHGGKLAPYLIIQQGRRAIPFLISTGLPVYMQISREDADLFNFKFPPVKGISLDYYDNQPEVSVGRASDDFYFGRHLILEPVISIVPGEENTIGCGILQHFTIIFDPFNKTIGIRRKSEVPIIIPPVRELGFRPELREDNWYVAEVFPWMKEIGIGLFPGDRIVMAEGIPSGQLAMNDWKFFARNNNYIALVLERKGEEVQLEVPLRIILP